MSPILQSGENIIMIGIKTHKVILYFKYTILFVQTADFVCGGIVARTRYIPDAIDLSGCQMNEPLILYPSPEGEGLFPSHQPRPSRHPFLLGEKGIRG
ncbi:hypothetical protein DRQ26_04320 [bacterium]|nr:MAG: hypothetical protein DRQ26_04320 [bacterium]